MVSDAPQYLSETMSWDQIAHESQVPFKHFLNEPNQSKLIGACVRVDR